MRDERGDPRFAAEPLHRLVPRHFLGTQELQRDVALKPQVARAIDFRRAVAADALEDLVMRDAQPGAAGRRVAIVGEDRGHGRVDVFARRANSARADASGEKSASAPFQVVNSCS